MALLGLRMSRRPFGRLWTCAARSSSAFGLGRTGPRKATLPHRPLVRSLTKQGVQEEEEKEEEEEEEEEGF